jgi:uncharacterized protein (DUF433 family)
VALSELLRLLVLAGWLSPIPNSDAAFGLAEVGFPRRMRKVLASAMEVAVANGVDIYGGVKPWDVPAYTLPTAARHVRIPAATLRSWVLGRPYEAANQTRHSPALIRVPQGRPRFLTFTNLVEAHVLASMRRKHELPMHKVRKAIKYLESELGVEHPLATETFKTNGVDLFVNRFGRLVNVSKDGQTEMKDAIEAGLTRINYEMGIASQLFPLIRADGFEQPKLIVIDPRVAFGRPVLLGTGVPVDEIAQRFQAGESAAELAKDFRVKEPMVEEAIRASRAAA